MRRGDGARRIYTELLTRFKEKFMKAVTIEDLKKELGDESAARAAYAKIARIGGFGDIGSEFKDGLPALDVGGLSEAKQKRALEVISEAKGEPEKAKTTDKPADKKQEGK